MEVMHKARIFILSLIIFAAFLASGHEVKAAAADDLHGWSWSERIGWISFNCTNLATCPPAGVNYGVDFSGAGAVTGWAWSENIGWVCFGSTCGGVAPDGNPSAASVNLATGEMRGWGQIVNLGSRGWVSLSCVDLATCGIVNYRVTVNFAAGTVSGWSWNGNSDGSGIGWMDWKFANVNLIELICDNGIDDDGDTLIDCADSDCDGRLGGTVSGNPVYCQFGQESGLNNCTDRFNNDADLYTDCEDQTSCWQNPAFGCAATETSCVDGIDNDNDDGSGNWDANSLTGRDCFDYDCAGNPACPATEISCVDGIDNDLDGDIDCADNDCAGECTSFCSLDAGRRCRVDADCAVPPAGICVVQPWLQTRFNNLYSRESISASSPPPSGGYNATYCLVSGSGMVSNFLSDPLYGCGAPPSAETFTFPQISNKYATDLGKIDVNGVLNGNYGTVVNISSSPLTGSTSLSGRVYSFNGDLHLGNPPAGLEFRAGVGSESGAGTYVIKGDLYIDTDVTYRSEPVSRIRNFASAGFLVLKRPDGSGGNIYINGNVGNVVGSFYAEGQFNTGSSANPLTVKGLIVAHEFVWGRTYADRARGSEEIIYDGRAAVNPPPGFSDVSKSLPSLRQGVTQ